MCNKKIIYPGNKNILADAYVINMLGVGVIKII